jgi:hypothetical protein
MQERSRESRAEADTGTMEPLSVSLEGRTAGIVVTRAGTPDHSIQPPPRQTSPS